jgi:hypothetical protein
MLKDFVLETSTAPGTGTTVTLAGAPAGRRTFAQAFSSGVNAFYFLDDGTQAEWGFGVFTAGSPNTITRGTVLGNTSGTTARLNFTGTTRVYNSAPSARTIYGDGSGNVSLGTGSLTVGALSATTGVFSGALSAVSAAITNAISAASATISGAISAASATISGAISAASATIANITSSGTIAGNVVNANGGTFQNISVPGTVTGNVVNANTATVTNINSSGSAALGVVSAATLQVAANVQAGTGGAGGGYYCRIGSTGGFGADVFNMYWNGTGMILYVDTTSLGYISTTSDGRYKHEVAPIADGALALVSRLAPVTYRWQDKGPFRDTGTAFTGFVAQDVYQIIPAAVTGDPSTDDMLSLQPVALIALLTKAIQELSARVNDLEAKLDGRGGVI